MTIAEQKAYQRKWYLANAEKKRATSAAWNLANRERQRENQQKWYLANVEKVCEISEAWRHGNSDRSRAILAAAQARHRAAEAGVSISRDPGIIDFYEFAGTAASAPCVYCGDDPGAGAREVDHKVSLAKGGPHALGNLCVACKTCNKEKGKRAADEFMALKAAA